MARLEVSLILIEKALFPDTDIKITDLKITNYGRDIVMLEIEGPTVPKVDLVTCTVHETYRHCTFEPVTNKSLKI